MIRVATLSACAALTLALANPAQAQETLNIDFFQGPLVSSGRVVGLGGAFVSVAEGADGHLVNPASLAIRYPYTADDWFDWDYALSLRKDTFLEGGIDLDRSGRAAAYDRTTFSQIGFNLKFGRFGIGIHIQSQEYQIDSELLTQTRTYKYIQLVGGLGAAWAAWDGELIMGIFLPVARSELKEMEAGSVALEGSALLLGTVYAPFGHPYRLGAALRSETLGQIKTRALQNPEGYVDDARFGILRVPDGISLPWEFNMGASWMFGPREYNPRPSFGAWEDKGLPRPETHRARKYILVAADLLVTGPSKQSVGVQAWIQNEQQQSGKFVSLSPRLGVESEILTNFMVVRGGSYYEPSRFKETFGRVHATTGFDLYLFDLVWAWKGNFVIDVAEDYVNWGLGLGFWH
jgi:hypothetical protein